MSSNDPFSDVSDEVLGAYGSLGGSGTGEHFKTDARPRKDKAGYDIVLRCDNCGTPQAVAVDWREIAFLANGKLPDPQQWKYDKGRIVPAMGCIHCRFPVGVGLTPDEATRWLNAGVGAGVLPRQAAQQLDQLAKSSR